MQSAYFVDPRDVKRIRWWLTSCVHNSLWIEWCTRICFVMQLILIFRRLLVYSRNCIESCLMQLPRTHMKGIQDRFYQQQLDKNGKCYTPNINTTLLRWFCFKMQKKKNSIFFFYHTIQCGKLIICYFKGAMQLLSAIKDNFLYTYSLQSDSWSSWANVPYVSAWQLQIKTCAVHLSFLKDHSMKWARQLQKW